MRATAFVAGVLAQFHEVLDVEVPRFQISAHGAFAFAALIHGHRSVIGHLEERNHTLALAVGALDVRPGGANIRPVITQPAGPLGQARVVGHQLEDALQIIIHRAQVAGGKLRMQRARVEKRGRGGHEPEGAERIVKLNRTLLLVFLVHRQAHGHAHVEILRCLNTGAADVDEVAIVDRLDSHVGKLLIPLQIEGVGQLIEVELQQIRRQTLGGHTLLQVLAEMFAVHLGQLGRGSELR